MQQTVAHLPAPSLMAWSICWASASTVSGCWADG
jgi:hypothetical protein